MLGVNGQYIFYSNESERANKDIYDDIENPLVPMVYKKVCQRFNPFKPEFTIVIFNHPLQAPNCCRNSRLVVDKDDLMWFKI